MNLLNNLRLRHAGLVLAATVMLGSPASAQTAIKFSLDFKFEGPSAPFLVAIDKGYFKAEGLDVTIDTAAGSLEPINRVASGTYDMGFGDINSLIKFRDANPATPIKAVFMVYNKPPFSIVGRKSRGVDEAEGPRRQEARRAGAGRRLSRSGRSSCRRTASTPPRSRSRTSASRCASRCCRAARSTPSPASRSRPSSTSRSMACRSTTSSCMLMADYGVNLYGNTIIVNPKFAAEKPEAVKGFLRAFVKGLQGHREGSVHRGRLGDQAQRRRQEDDRARTPATWRSRTTS